MDIAFLKKDITSFIVPCKAENKYRFCFIIRILCPIMVLSSESVVAGDPEFESGGANPKTKKKEY